MERLGIVAGRGSLPQKLIDDCLRKNRPFCVVALKKQFEGNIPSHIKTIEIRLGAGGTALKFLREQGAKEIVFAGGVKRPSLTSLRPDAWSAKQLKKFNKKRVAGDDGLLTTIIDILEKEEGFKIVGAHEILPSLVAKQQLYGHIAPDEKSMDDIKKAFEVAKEIGRLDIGQACVVSQSTVVAVEAIEGTDNMLKRLLSYKEQSKGGVLLKAAKPNQELRIDMPTIGLKTLYNAKKAGLKGIAIEDSAALIMEPEKVAETADELGLFVMGVNEHMLQKPYISPKRIYIIAGEASGDKLGASLMENLQKLYPGQYQFMGIGGPLMTEQGLNSLFPMGELSLMGLTAILPKIPNLLKRIHQTVDHILRIEPDMVLTIDSPGFNKKVAQKIREKNPEIKLTHWVAPSVWAWKPKRAKKMAQLYDNLLCLLPFEPPYFEKEGLKTYFTGHPITSSKVASGSAKNFKNKFKVSETTTLIATLPGSRMSEVKRLLPIYKEALMLLKEKYTKLKIVIPVTPNVADYVKKEVQDWPIKAIFVENEQDKYDAFATAQVALAASGTVSLELAMAELPMVIAYSFGKVTDTIAKMLIKAKYASIINIMQDKAVIPEYLAENCNAKEICAALHLILSKEMLPDFSAWQESLKQLGLGEKSGEKAAHIFHGLFNEEKGENNEISVSSHHD